jgi:two-component system response regulator
MRYRHLPIMLVEDSDEDAEVAVACLRRVGVRNPVTRVASAAELVAQVARIARGEASAPALLLLDLNLPGLTGIDVLRSVRNEPLLAATPVCVLSTSADPDEIAQAWRLGAAGWLTKPLDLARFESQLAHWAGYWLDAVTHAREH